MNFFDDNYHLGATPTLYKRKTDSSANKSPRRPYFEGSSKMSAKDELDLLDTLLDKGKPMGRKQGSVSSFGMGSTNKDYQDNVNTKKGIHDRKGSSSMDLAPNFSFFKPVKANPTPPQQPYPQYRQNRWQNDDLSEDNPSYTSGFTNRRSNMDKYDNVPKKDDYIHIPSLGSLRNMKPPLRKKEYRSIHGHEDISIPASQLGSLSHIDYFDQNRAIFAASGAIERQLYGYFKRKYQFGGQLQKNYKNIVPYIAKQHYNEIKMIKESYEKHLKLQNDTLQKEREEHGQAIDKITKKYEKMLQDYQTKWEKIMKAYIDRLKYVHNWYSSKRKYMYEMEIDKLKQCNDLSKMLGEAQKNMRTGELFYDSKQKYVEMKLQRDKIEYYKRYLYSREKEFERREKEFELYRQREYNKLTSGRRELSQQEAEHKREQLYWKRTMGSYKQNMAQYLATGYYYLMQKRQYLYLQKEYLKINWEMFKKYKEKYEAFNAMVIGDYKNKLADVYQQKYDLNLQQIELYNKIHTVEIVGNKLRAYYSPKKNISVPFVPPSRTYRSVSQPIKENIRNRSNNQFQAKINSTQKRFRDMYNWVKTNAIQLNPNLQKETVSFEQYLGMFNKKK